MQALILRSGEPSGSGAAVWVPSEDTDQILRTHGECLIFVDGLGGDSTSPLWLEKMRLDFNAKYPSDHPLLNRLSIDMPYGYDNKKDHGCYHWLKQVIVEALGARVYRGEDAEDVCSLARLFGKIRVNTAYFRILRDSYSDDHTETMEELGCYYRDNGDGREVVYNPKVIQRRIKRDRNPNRKAKGDGRIVPWLKIDELISGIESMVKILAKHDCIDRWSTHPWKIIGYSKGSRHSTLQVWEDGVTMFNGVFGKNAHRHVPEFQEFLRGLWKRHGDATRRSFGTCGSSWRSSGEHLFNFLDYELTVRKPRKRKHTLNETLANRSPDWRSIEQRENEAKYEAEQVQLRELEEQAKQTKEEAA